MTRLSCRRDACAPCAPQYCTSYGHFVPPIPTYVLAAATQPALILISRGSVSASYLRSTFATPSLPVCGRLPADSFYTIAPPTSLGLAARPFSPLFRPTVSLLYWTTLRHDLFQPIAKGRERICPPFRTCHLRKTTKDAGGDNCYQLLITIVKFSKSASTNYIASIVCMEA